MKIKTLFTEKLPMALKQMLALGFWRNYKCYIELPFKSNWRVNDWKTHIPICAGMNLSWKDYEFDLCDTEYYFPKGRKIGKHKFSITFGAFYWWIHFTFYSPKT